MKKILILTTGGTIASSQTGNGLSPCKNDIFDDFLYQEECKNLYPMEEFGGCEVELEWKSILNIDSSNVSPADWIAMAEHICIGLEDVSIDGIVVTHGTDTMAYTTAGITYLLKSINKPVIFTGSQLPYETPNTDAKKNLVDAISVACTDYAGIAIAFGGKIIDGLHAKKVYAKEMLAFESINCKDIGRISADGTVIWNNSENGVFFQNNIPVFDAIDGSSNVASKEFSDIKIGCIKLIPGENSDMIDLLVDNGYKAIIIEAFGCGGIPNRYGYFLSAIKRAVTKEVLVCISSQCTYDGTDLSVYEVGIAAKKVGAISAGRMTIEALSAKIRYVLCNATSYADAVKLMLAD